MRRRCPAEPGSRRRHHFRTRHGSVPRPSSPERRAGEAKPNSSSAAPKTAAGARCPENTSAQGRDTPRRPLTTHPWRSSPYAVREGAAPGHEHRESRRGQRCADAEIHAAEQRASDGVARRRAHDHLNRPDPFPRRRGREGRRVLSRTIPSTGSGSHPCVSRRRRPNRQFPAVCWIVQDFSRMISRASPHVPPSVSTDGRPTTPPSP